MREHTSACVRIRQHASAFKRERWHWEAFGCLYCVRLHFLTDSIEWILRLWGYTSESSALIEPQQILNRAWIGLRGCEAVWGHIYSSVRTHVEVWGHIYSSSRRTHIARRLATWGHIYSSMRTHTQQHEDINSSMRTHTQQHEDTYIEYEDTYTATWGHI